MNDRREFATEPDGGDDEDRTPLAWLATLQRVEPSLEARLANRTSVAAELARLQVAKRRSSPWWRRTVSVPIPAVIGLAALAITALALGLSSPEGIQPIENRSANSDVERREAVGLEQTPGRTTTHQTAALPRMQYYETRTYLCGVGFVASESGYETKEQLP